MRTTQRFTDLPRMGAFQTPAVTKHPDTSHMAYVLEDAPNVMQAVQLFVAIRRQYLKFYEMKMS